MVKKYWLALLLTILNTTVVGAAAVDDPTRPIFSQNKSSTPSSSKNKKIQLSAIFIRQGLKQVIINDKLYKLGDFFGNKKIVKIKNNKVILKNNHGTSQLTLTRQMKKLKK